MYIEFAMRLIYKEISKEIGDFVKNPFFIINNKVSFRIVKEIEKILLKTSKLMWNKNKSIFNQEMKLQLIHLAS